jgi:hypothetical protein
VEWQESTVKVTEEKEEKNETSWCAREIN